MYFSPLKRDEAIEKGFKWTDYTNPENQNMVRISAEDLPNKIEDVKDDILQKAIACQDCGKLFKIIPQELEKYRKWKIALPHICCDCRHFSRKNKMNPRVLHDRTCDKCGIKIKSTYDKSRKEISTARNVI